MELVLVIAALVAIVWAANRPLPESPPERAYRERVEALNGP